MIIIEEGGRRVCYPDPGYIFTSDGTDQYEYYDGNVPFDQVLVELPVNYTWGESMDPVQPEPGSMSTKNTMTVGNSLFDNNYGGLSHKIHIIDNHVQYFDAYVAYYLFNYQNIPILQQGRDFVLDYENVTIFTTGFNNNTFRSLNNLATRFELLFPRASTVQLPIMGGDDQQRLTSLSFVPKILFADEVAYIVGGTSAGAILMSDGTPTNVFWMVASATNYYVIMNGYEQTVTIQKGGDHMTLGDWEWWATSDSKIHAKKIGT